MAKDKELADHERAHTGQPGSKVRHGADAVGKIPLIMDKQGMIDMHNAHAEARGDIRVIPSNTKLSHAQVKAKLDRVHREADSWTDLP